MNLIVSGTNGEITVENKYLHLYDAVLRGDQGLTWDQHITYWRVIGKSFLYESKESFENNRSGFITDIVWLFDHQEGKEPMDELREKFFKNDVSFWNFTSVRDEDQ